MHTSISNFKLISAATTNITLVKAGNDVRLRGVCVSSINAAARYLKFFDLAATASLTLGTTVPDLTLIIPGAAAGAGIAYNFPDEGVPFRNGIVIATTTEITTAGTTAVSASEHSIQISYQ